MQLNKFSWGGAAAIMTSMGLIAGLDFSSEAKATIIGGLLILAIADNIPDSFGIHIYKETETPDHREALATSFGNFLSRLLVTISFAVLVILLPKNTILIFTTAWGMALLTIISIMVSRIKKVHWSREVGIHLGLAAVIVLASKFIGDTISKYFI